MSYLEYARCTWAQFILKCEGFEELQLREERRIRRVCWQIFNSYPKKEGADLPEDIFEYMPLPGDPTKKQRDKEKKKAYVTDTQKLIKMYEDAGYLKDGKIVYN